METTENNSPVPPTIRQLRARMGAIGIALIHEWHPQTLKVLQAAIEEAPRGTHPYSLEYQLRDAARMAARVYSSALCSRRSPVHIGGHYYESVLMELLKNTGYTQQVYPILPRGLWL